MASATISPVREFRDALYRRGGKDSARCFQCATCSSVCDLATPETMFPRRQILWAQWGLVDRIKADPAIWLCHQCNDCTVRCPRDAKPGDALQAIRSLMIEQVGAPKFMAQLVGRAGTTWPILLGVPVLFWALFIYAVNGFAAPTTPLSYGDLVPAWMIQSVFVPVAVFATVAAAIGARRCWTAWGEGAVRNGTLLRGLAGVAMDILTHRRLKACGAARPRELGHFLLLWGFVGAFLTTVLLGVAMDVFGVKTPLPQQHPIKILGNLSAVLLVVGVAWLLVNRVARARAAGTSHAFDTFFLALVISLIATGVGAEIGRYLFPAPVALAIYVLHLGMILSLFLTFPFSKFAHALYRTLAMAHEHLTEQRRPS
jgi:quinone-modifying oxidoreductase subunit QmoC